MDELSEDDLFIELIKIELIEEMIDQITSIAWDQARKKHLIEKLLANKWPSSQSLIPQHFFRVLCLRCPVKVLRGAGLWQLLAPNKIKLQSSYSTLGIYMAKCPICNSRKGKRKCLISDSFICSLCCGNIRKAETCLGCTFYQKPKRKYNEVPGIFSIRYGW